MTSSWYQISAFLSLCDGNLPLTRNVFMSWRHHVYGDRVLSIMESETGKRAHSTFWITDIICFSIILSLTVVNVGRGVGFRVGWLWLWGGVGVGGWGGVGVRWGVGVEWGAGWGRGWCGVVGVGVGWGVGGVGVGWGCGVGWGLGVARIYFPYTTAVNKSARQLSRIKRLTCCTRVDWGGKVLLTGWHFMKPRTIPKSQTFNKNCPNF